MDLFNADITAERVAKRLLKQMTKAVPIAKVRIKRDKIRVGIIAESIKIAVV